MAEIAKIIGVDNRGTHAIVHVLVKTDELGNLEEATVYVGGSVELFEHNGLVKAFVKKKKG